MRLATWAIAAALFALHPVQVQSVAWISELKNTLSGVFFLLSALLYLRFDDQRSVRDYARALGVFVIALMTKSVTAVLPGVLLVLLMAIPYLATIYISLREPLAEPPPDSYTSKW